MELNHAGPLSLHDGPSGWPMPSDGMRAAGPYPVCERVRGRRRPRVGIGSGLQSKSRAGCSRERVAVESGLQSQAGCSHSRKRVAGLLVGGACEPETARACIAWDSRLGWDSGLGYEPAYHLTCTPFSSLLSLSLSPAERVARAKPLCAQQVVGPASACGSRTHLLYA